MTNSHADNSDFTVTFWGVRGTMPVTDPAFSKIGGNTSCVEVKCGAKRLILDAGTGIVGLGRKICEENNPPRPRGGRKGGQSHGNEPIDGSTVSQCPPPSPPQAGGVIL